MEALRNVVNRFVTVKDHDSPLLVVEPLHNLLCLPGAFVGVGDHRVCRDADGATYSGKVAEM